MAQQTAVAWYYEQTVVLCKTNYAELYEQAQQMEKQQIIDAYYYDPNCDEIKDDGEQYYNETYGKP